MIYKGREVKMNQLQAKITAKGFTCHVWGMSIVQFYDMVPTFIQGKHKAQILNYI